MHMINLVSILAGTFLLGGGLGGLMLLRRGMRGVAIDDHPLCGRCGFDLIGLPDGVNTCSECGANVGIASAIRIGHREKRPRLIVVGTLLLVSCLVISTVVLTSIVGAVQWIQYEPLWLLRRQAMSSTATPAGAEILRRIQGGALSDAQVQFLVDQVLLIQADPKQKWNPQWGDWVETARAAKKVLDGQWRSYLANAVAVNLVARSEIHRGEGLPLRTERPGARVGSKAQFWMETQQEYEKESVVSTRTSGTFRNGSSLTAAGGGASTGVIRLDPQRVAAASDGPQTLKVRLKVKVYDTPAPTKAPAATRDIDIEGRGHSCRLMSRR
jgi:hypothetical protein